MPHHTTSYYFPLGQAHAHTHTLHGQDKFLEIRHVLATGQRSPSLKIDGARQQ